MSVRAYVWSCECSEGNISSDVVMVEGDTRFQWKRGQQMKGTKCVPRNDRLKFPTADGIPKGVELTTDIVLLNSGIEVQKEDENG